MSECVGASLVGAIDREIQFLARLPRIRPVQCRQYSRSRLESHKLLFNEEVTTISGRVLTCVSAWGQCRPVKTRALGQRLA